MASSTPFRPVARSLRDLAGEEYVAAACEARAALTGEERGALLALAEQPVECYPEVLHARLLSLLPRVGQALCQEVSSARGASSQAFASATQAARAPVSGLGWYRVGEDGRLYLTTKSEHYHTPLGHSFPGYRLLEIARQVGIPNATHNSTRGHLTRRLEEELVRVANGIEDGASLDAVLACERLDCPNRVLNLETGSLAMEAAVKLLLARFYRVQEDAPGPRYQGRVPVFLVMASDDGDPQANYHGTTVLTQLLRGMWPDLAEALRQHGLYQVHAIRCNHLGDLEDAFTRWERPPYKLAGFLHEIVMMNYGARLLTREFLQRAYALCAAHDVPAVADEIQSCLWAPKLFLFREYGLRPSCVAVGKGFPGGEYPASRLLFSAALDSLPLFGALVTNGQEELASLAYLVTMAWAKANAEATRTIGERYEARLRELAAAHPGVIAEIPGQRHLCGIAFHELATARAFVKQLNEGGLDVSTQTYKADCPPVVLTKLPLIASDEVVDFVIGRMAGALAALHQERARAL
jgi:acetylornithine/succinyldiaminopimelate/putrescine aminotransferase